MLFLILFTFVFSKNITLQSQKTFTFQKTLKKGELFKFEYHEEGNKTPHILIEDDLKRKLLDTTTTFGVIHWSSSRDATFTVKMKNTGNDTMRLYFRTPDVNKELYSAIGPITDKDVLAEFDNALKKNIQDQRNYLDGLKEHEEMTIRIRKMVGWLIFIEIISCGGFIYYLHRKTISMFEKRSRI